MLWLSYHAVGHNFFELGILNIQSHLNCRLRFLESKFINDRPEVRSKSLPVLKLENFP